MFFISFFLKLIISDCEDYKFPSVSRSFINSLRSLKSSKSMLLFGIDSYADFPIVSNFEELKDKVLPFLMGQFYTNFLLFILGLIAFFFFIACTILITTCCTPRERSKPGFFTTIIWWIIFSILFLVSIIYFILSIAYAPNFINNFHMIPEIVQNGFTKIINDINLFMSKYTNEVTNILKGDSSIYPSFVLLMNDDQTSIAQTFLNHLDALEKSINNPTICDNTYVNCESLNRFISGAQEICTDLSLYINTIIKTSNIQEIYIKNSLTIPYLVDFVGLNYPKALLDITQYSYNEVEKSKKSFDTNRDYVNIPMKGINIVILILVIVFYVFQTVTFFTQLPFSRCCVISIYPISIVASFGISVIGIFATSVSCAIGDVCSDPTRFVSQYFFLRNETRLNYRVPAYNPQLFDSPDNNLFTAISGQYFINFDDILLIEQSATNLPEIKFNGDFTYDPNSFIPIFDLINNNDIYNNLLNLYNIFAAEYAKASINNDQNLDVYLNRIKVVIDVINDVNYRYSLQSNTIAQLKNFENIPITLSRYRNDYLNANANTYIPHLRAFATQQMIVNTSSFCCPVRETKKIFCKDTAATFSCFAIFAHFYVLSLIGFGIVLCFRRQGMLSSTYGIDDDKNETEKKKKDIFSDDEPKTTDFIRPSQPAANRDARQWTMSDASDSESKSSFTTLDMYAQSKIL